MRSLALAVILAASSNAAFALAIPAPGQFDDRVRFIDYQAADVTKLTVHFGYQTNIVFSPGERVLEKGIYLGDPNAWDVATLNNHLFVKPKAEGGRTNMTVLTNRRAYSFDLSSHWPQKTAPKDMQYQVNFTYPGDQALVGITAAAVTAKLQDEASMKAKLLERPSPKNWSYSVQGSASVTPDAAWDDGKFTYFRFVGTREMPAIFLVNEDGSESLVNRNVEGDTIVIQSLAKKFVLRKGQQVACIFNDAFDPIGEDLQTGTTTDDVVREIKGRTE